MPPKIEDAVHPKKVHHLQEAKALQSSKSTFPFRTPLRREDAILQENRSPVKEESPECHEQKET